MPVNQTCQSQFSADLSESFESFAQNGEDVMLWRALRDVDHGFYIDAGAAEPESDSVTHAFYLRGWRGINIEPTPDAFARLQAARPEDINLNIAVGHETGRARLFLVNQGNGLSTLDADGAEKLRRQGWDIAQTSVAVKTLADICEEHDVKTIHFLKIDVEGSERSVLEGADLKRFRPWIILLEATEPNSQVPTHHAWEELLLAADYQFVWFDGLNRFYVSQEMQELAQFFRAPVNVFDGAIRHSEAATREQLAQTQAELKGLNEKLASGTAWADGQIAALTAGMASLKEAVAARTAEMAALEEAVATRTAEMAALEKVVATRADEISRLTVERDAWAQDLFETNRYAMQVTLERQNAIDERRRLQQELESRIATMTLALERSDAVLRDMRASTSWKISRPVRLIGRLIGRK